MMGMASWALIQYGMEEVMEGRVGFGKGSFLQMADHVYTKRPHKLVLLNHTRLNNYWSWLASRLSVHIWSSTLHGRIPLVHDSWGSQAVWVPQFNKFQPCPAHLPKNDTKYSLASDVHRAKLQILFRSSCPMMSSISTFFIIRGTLTVYEKMEWAMYFFITATYVPPVRCAYQYILSLRLVRPPLLQ